ncbi:MAG: flagellar assembly protein FliH [Magnetospirillum sp.]|nr:flagellar assembly protein FliH [Magnetospirillum sp.]
MATIRKYMFDLDFDPHAVRRPVLAEEEARAEERTVEPDEPPAPTFTEEELALARDLAFDEGRRAGLAEGAESTERQIATALGMIAGHFDTLQARQEEANDTAQRNAARVALAVVKKMLPAACEQYAFDEVTRVVEEVVGHILDEPRIIVRVAQALAEPVRERLEAVAEGHGFEGRVVVQADERLAVGDCRVEWTDGGAERDQARLWQEVETVVERALAPPERRSAGSKRDADAGV